MSRKRILRRRLRRGSGLVVSSAGLATKGTTTAFKVFLTTVPIAIFSFHMGLKLYVRKEVARGLMEEYNFAPQIMGRVFYAAKYGKIPVHQVTEAEMKVLAAHIARKIVPFYSRTFTFPTKESITAWVQLQLAQMSALEQRKQV